MSTAISVRIESANKAKASGERKHDLRLYKTDKEFPNYIARERSHLNSVIIEPPLAHALSEEIAEARKAKGQQSLRKDACVAITGLINFGHEAQTIIDGLPSSGQDEIFKSVAERLARESGHPLIGLVVHRDESAIHAHFILRGFAKDENGFERPWRKDRWFGAMLQDWAADEVAYLGITRGKPKCLRTSEGEPDSAWVHRSVKKLHQDLPAEIAELERKKAAAEERANKNERLAESAEAKGKAVAETYRRRQNEAEEEHQKILDKLSKMQADLSGLKANAKAATEAKEAAETALSNAQERFAVYFDSAIAKARRQVDAAKLPSITPEVETVKNILGVVKGERRIVPFEKFQEYERARQGREDKLSALLAASDTKRREMQDGDESRQSELNRLKTAALLLADKIKNRPAGECWGFEPWTVCIEKRPIDGISDYLAAPDVLRSFEEGDTRYGVALKIFPKRVVVPTQARRVTSRQIAAALYRVAQERAKEEEWPGIVFTASDMAMANRLHEMAQKDGIAVEIRYTDGAPFSPPQRQLAANDQQDATPARRLGR